MDAIKIENLTKKYGKLVAVDNLTLSVKKGEFMAIFGGKLLDANAWFYTLIG